MILNEEIPFIHFRVLFVALNLLLFDPSVMAVSENIKLGEWLCQLSSPHCGGGEPEIILFRLPGTIMTDLLQVTHQWRSMGSRDGVQDV